VTIASNDAIKAIAGMSAPQIILRWKRVHGVPAPAIALSLLARDLAHQVQVEAAGGIDKRLERRLRDLVVSTESDSALHGERSDTYSVTINRATDALGHLTEPINVRIV
jgi:Protein of unknown function (DUF2924)